MFGTIAHATLKPGQQGKLDELMKDWERDILPKIPGTFLQLTGHQADNPGQIVFVALAQDEATYRALAAMPEQHAFYLRFNDVFTGEPAWEDVAMELHKRD